MPWETAEPGDVESKLPDEAGGMWFMKDALDTDHVAFTVLDLEPGTEGIEHAHDEQEEVYYVVEGGVDLDFGERTVSLDENEAVRVDPQQSRQIRNRDHFSRLVLVGAPRDAN